MEKSIEDRLLGIEQSIKRIHLDLAVVARYQNTMFKYHLMRWPEQKVTSILGFLFGLASFGGLGISLWALWATLHNRIYLAAATVILCLAFSGFGYLAGDMFVYMRAGKALKELTSAQEKFDEVFSGRSKDLAKELGTDETRNI